MMKSEFKLVYNIQIDASQMFLPAVHFVSMVATHQK